MKLNLGAGNTKYEGFFNVDADPECNPDYQWNLEQTPWPFETDSVTLIYAYHIFEHLGQQPQTFLDIMKEMYRVCAHHALIEIKVPHVSHDNFFSDPTHVRAITPSTMGLFDRSLNLKWQAEGAANSPFALRLGIDFRVVQSEYRLANDPALDQLRSNHPLLYEVMIKYGRNVLEETWIKLQVQK